MGHSNGLSSDPPSDLFPVAAPTKVHKSTNFLRWAGAKIDEETGRVTPKEKPKRRTTMAASTFNRARAEMQGMLDSKDWSDLKPRHLLALYDLMHLQCYGVEAVMTGTERHIFVLRAGGFWKREFDGDIEKVRSFFQWVWTKEIKDEKWRRENGRTGWMPLSFGQTISGQTVTRYRVALNRKMSIPR